MKIIDRLVRLGATAGSYGAVATAFAATLCANPESVSALIPFMAGIGANLVAAILDRAARGEDPTDDEIIAALQGLKQKEAEKSTLLEEISSRFRADIGVGLDMIAQRSADSSAEHAELRELIAGMDANAADGLQQVVRVLKRISRQLESPTPSGAEQHQVLLAYAEWIANAPRYTRMGSGGLTAESPRVEDSVREPHLDDIFIEPNLAGAASWRESWGEVEELVRVSQDDEMEPPDRDEARGRLLRMQGETWDAIRKGGVSRKASEALKEKQAAVILGDPGSGKSTLFRWLMVEQAKSLLSRGDGPIPVFMAIGDYANAWKREKNDGLSLPLLDYLTERLNAEHKGMGGVLSSALEDGGRGILLLLDGLDEVPRVLRRSVVLHIHEFIADHTQPEGKTRVLVSSRFFGYEEAPIPSPAVQLVVTPFDDNQIKAFARKWYLWLERHIQSQRSSESEAEAHARRFEESVFARPQITELARNPLMLTMIAVVIRQGKRLPERRVELYDLTLRQLMTQWEYLRSEADEQAGFKVDFNEACQLWAPIARWMHEVGTGAVHEAELKQRLEERIKELELDHKAEEWLTVRGDKCCLLQERGPRIFGFLHQTFQEYLAAMDILHDGEFVGELTRYVEDPRWHEVLRLACGYLGVVCVPPKKKEVTDLLRHILDNGSSFEHLLHRDLFLAASCIADDVKPRKGIEQQIVGDLLDLAASDEMERLRLEAIHLTVMNGRTQVEEALVRQVWLRLAYHRDGLVRTCLAAWLAQQTFPSVDALIRELREETNGASKYMAMAIILERKPTQRAIDDLLAHLPKHGFAAKNINSILLKNKSSLIEATGSGQPIIRFNAACLLVGTDQNDLGVSVLASFLAQGDDRQRCAAAAVLLDTSYRGQALSTLIDQLGHSDFYVRWDAARRLYNSQHRDLAEHALLGFLDHPEAFIRRLSASKLLNSQFHARAVDTLESLLSDANSTERHVAARKLAQSGNLHMAIGALRMLLDLGIIRDRMAAAHLLLGTEYHNEAVDTMLSALVGSHDTEERREAAEAIAHRSADSNAYLSLAELIRKRIGVCCEGLSPEDPLYEAIWSYAMVVTNLDAHE